MQRTTHTTHKHTRRKPLPGLTPGDVITQMAAEAENGNPMRDLRKAPVKPKEPLLRKTCEGGTAADGEERVPSTAGGANPERIEPNIPASLPDTPGGAQLSLILKRMLGELPPSELLDLEGASRLVTNAEALAAVIMHEALLNRKQWAIELIRDQVEGKPVRAAQVNTSEGEVDEMLDRVSAARLNQIAKGS